MATTFPLSLVLLFFTLSPLPSHSANNNMESLVVPSTVTPRAAAIQYWYAKVHNNKPPPHALLSQLSSHESPLELLITYTDYLKSLRSHPSNESENAHEELMHKRNQLLVWRSHGRNGEEDLRQKRNQLSAWRNHEGLQKESEKDDKHGDIHADTAIDPLGDYFRVSNLRQGNIMRFVDFRDYFPQQYFLPRTLASKMPLNSTAAVKKMFHITPADTVASKEVDLTVKHCNMPPDSPEEMRQCVTSAEDLVDFVIKALGTDDFEARSTESTGGCGRDVLIGAVKLVNQGKALTCHQVEFPYLVHHCHVVLHTRAYEVEILDVESKEKINHAIATCHMDTSMVSPTHEAFRALKSEAGKTEICHFIYKSDILWTPAAANVVVAEA